MNIYDEDGALDYEKARAEVKTAADIGDERTVTRRLTEIRTAAAVDIAASLGMLALQAALAIGEARVENDDEPDEQTEVDRDFLVVGDLVHVTGGTEPGEVVRLGFDQGEMYADVTFAEGQQERFYTRNLQRIIGDAYTDTVAERVIETLEQEESALDEGDPADEFEDAPAKPKKGKR